MTRRRAALAVLFVMLLGLAPAAVEAQSGPQGVAPGLGIRLVDAPVDRKDDPRASLYVIDHVAPGASITRHIEVSNGTDKPITVQTYAAAAELVDGTFKVVEGRSTNELTSWTTVEPSSLTLAVGERKQARVTIKVPADASEGERYAVALAELPPEPTGGGTVAIASRVGVRLYLSVGPGGEPASDFEVDTLTARRDPDGTPVVSALVRNTGGRALDMSGELELSEGPGGLRGGPYPAKLGTTLAIGGSAPVEILLDKGLQPGPWKATLKMRSGLLERTVTGVITFPEPGETAAPVKAKRASARGSAALPVAVGSLGAVIGLFFFIFWKRRKKKEEDEEDEVNEAGEVEQQDSTP